MILLILSFDTEENKDKFEYIFYKYRKLMLHKAYEILQDYYLAEDAASEAFIRIHKNMHKIGDPDDKKSIAFIVTIVKNTALTILSKTRSQATEEYDEEQAADFNLEEQTIAHIGADEIYDILNVLGEELKSVFLLRYAHDMSHKEIGKTLGISENNVTVRLHRAKKKLAEIISQRESA